MCNAKNTSHHKIKEKKETKGLGGRQEASFKLQASRYKSRACPCFSTALLHDHPLLLGAKLSAPRTEREQIRRLDFYYTYAGTESQPTQQEAKRSTRNLGCMHAGQQRKQTDAARAEAGYNLPLSSVTFGASE